MTRLRTRLLALIGAAALVLTVGPPVGRTAHVVAAVNTADAVHWSLDEPNKQVIVAVKLQFWNEQGCSTKVGGEISCTGAAPSAALIQHIVDGILRYWKGHKYKCWEVVIRITTEAISGPRSASADAVDIALIDTPVHVTPYVLSTNNHDHYLSTDPADRVNPVRDASQIDAEWPTRSTAPDHIYAHEFGHILGLDDNYSEKDGALLPGATPDLMWGQGDSALHVSEDMVTRMVKRSGLPLDKIKCPMTSNGGPTSLNLLLATLDNVSMHIYTCDYDPPTTDPKHKPAPISWKGTAHLGGSYLAQISIPGLPGASGSVDVPVAFSAVIPAGGGTLTIPMGSDTQIQIPVVWGADGILHASDAASLGGSGGVINTAYFFPGPPLMAVFTPTAAECPT